MKKNLIVIAGPTAIGKTDLAIRLAEQLQCEIISADSRQFYKEMSIGTAKPTDEELKRIPHHFIGHVSIFREYNVSDYVQEVERKLAELFQKYDYAIMVGGSGLYIKSVLEGLDDLPHNEEVRKEILEIYHRSGIEALQNLLPEKDKKYFNYSDYHNPVRLVRAIEIYRISGEPFSELINKGGVTKKSADYHVVPFLLQMDRAKLYERINLRVDKMMHEGLLQEAQNLYPYKYLKALNTVGYKELFDYFDGKTTLKQAVEKIKQHTRNYAKRQITWFKKQNYMETGSNEIDKITEIIKTTVDK